MRRLDGLTKTNDSRDKWPEWTWTHERQPKMVRHVSRRVASGAGNFISSFAAGFPVLPREATAIESNEHSPVLIWLCLQRRPELRLQ